jgi:hypothetical protein
VSLYEDWEFYARIAKRHALAFADAETATNRSHQGLERLTRGPRVAKVESYLGLLDRVWKADPGFIEEHGEDLRRVESRALMALAREGALASRPDVVDRALVRWRAQSPPVQEGRVWARIYELSGSAPGGAVILRFLLRVSTMLKVLTKRQQAHYSVNPAA